MPVDIVRVIEAAYAVELPEAEWLQGCIDAARPEFGADLGAGAYLYDISVRPIRVWRWMAPMRQEEYEAAVGGVDEEFIENGWLTRHLSATSELPRFDRQKAMVAHLTDYGVADVISVNALDASGVGICIGNFFSARKGIDPQIRELWSRLCAHLAAGLRLRMRLALRPNERSLPEAVLSANGRLEHAESAEVVDAHRRTLVQAAIAIQHARGPLRDDSERAVEAWRVLVRERWSLVDHFESDGKRYIFARRNVSDIDGPRSLTERERQILARLVLGRSPKLIAYELGLAASTVRVHLTNVMRKFKATSREDLVEKYRAHVSWAKASGEDVSIATEP